MPRVDQHEDFPIAILNLNAVVKTDFTMRLYQMAAPTAHPSCDETKAKYQHIKEAIQNW